MTTAIWLFGLSGSGKTTIAKLLEQHMVNNNVPVQLLDGDTLRTGLNKDLSYTTEDRTENIRRAAEVGRLFTARGITTIHTFITPTNEMRRMVRGIVGDALVMIYVNASINTCIDRDVKGLYKRAISGDIKNFTGISSVFEEPDNYDIEANTDRSTAEECADLILTQIYKL